MTPAEITEKIESNYERLNTLLAEAVRVDAEIIKILEENSDLRAMLGRGQDET